MLAINTPKQFKMHCWAPQNPLTAAVQTTPTPHLPVVYSMEGNTTEPYSMDINVTKPYRLDSNETKPYSIYRNVTKFTG